MFLESWLIQSISCVLWCVHNTLQANYGEVIVIVRDPGSLHFRQKYRKVPRSTAKYPEVPQSTQKYLNVSEVPRSISKYLQVPKSTQKYLKVPRSTSKYQVHMPNCTALFLYQVRLLRSHPSPNVEMRMASICPCQFGRHYANMPWSVSGETRYSQRSAQADW